MNLEPEAKTYIAGALQALNVSSGMTAHRQFAEERDRQLYLFAFHDALIGIALTMGLELDLGECPCPCPLPPPAPRMIAEPGPALTPRELEIGRLLVAGMSRKEIAHELVLSSWTIKSHTDKLYRKLGIHSKAGLRGHFEQLPAIEGAIRHG